MAWMYLRLMSFTFFLAHKKSGLIKYQTAFAENLYKLVTKVTTNQTVNVAKKCHVYSYAGLPK